MQLDTAVNELVTEEDKWTVRRVSGRAAPLCWGGGVAVVYATIDSKIRLVNEGRGSGGGFTPAKAD